MESTLEQIQLSVLGDGKYNLRSSSGIYNNKPFRSQHHLLPGAKVPDVELSLPGTSFLRTGAKVPVVELSIAPANRAWNGSSNHSLANKTVVQPNQIILIAHPF